MSSILFKYKRQDKWLKCSQTIKYQWIGKCFVFSAQSCLLLTINTLTAVTVQNPKPAVFFAFGIFRNQCAGCKQRGGRHLNIKCFSSNMIAKKQRRQLIRCA